VVNTVKQAKAAPGIQKVTLSSATFMSCLGFRTIPSKLQRQCDGSRLRVPLHCSFDRFREIAKAEMPQS
jgi:hypothetical protein